MGATLRIDSLLETWVPLFSIMGATYTIAQLLKNGGA